MPYYLYTLTTYNNSLVGFSLPSQGVTAIVEHDFTTNTAAENRSGMTINSPSTPEDGEAPGFLANEASIATDSNPFYRVNQGVGSYGGTKNFFGLLIGDTEVSSVASWLGVIETEEEEDWEGQVASLTWHTPSLTTDTYTLIVPTDNVIYQTEPQRSGNALVWHIPVDQLGIYAQNANLPSGAESVIGDDSDAIAGGKIWGMGFGLISEEGTPLPFLNII